MKYFSEALFEACQKVKFTNTYKYVVSISRPIEFMHIDLFGPLKTAFVNGKKYGLVIVDDYNRWTWVKLLRHKDEPCSVLSTFCSEVQNEKYFKIV